MMHVWLHDRLVDPADALVSVFDRGLRTGEGVFETLRSYLGHPFRLGAHLDRAESGARSLRFDFPDRARVEHAVRTTARANDTDGDQVLRLTITPGVLDPRSPFPGRPIGSPTLIVTAQPLELPEGLYERGVTAVTVERSRELPDVKAVSYLSASLARREAQERGAEEALLVNQDGAVLEGSYSNVFLVRDGMLITPGLDVGILAGVTRAVVLEVAEHMGLDVQQREVEVAELGTADEAFLTATTREVVPLVAIDGSPVGDGHPGPLSRQLLDAYRQEVRREVAADRRDEP